MNLNFDLDTYISWIENEASRGSARFDLFSVDYVKSHERRYRKTLELINKVSSIDSVIEIGATDFFQIYMKNVIGSSHVWATIFSDDIEQKYYSKVFEAAGFTCESQVVSINLENEMVPVNDGSFDLVVFCEVLEHLDIDPMFCMSEINRLLKDGGYLILTTPNSCSARIAYKCCLGYRPQFHMQYERSRSPYRHNFEYDSHSLTELLTASGFSIEILDSHDVFDDTWPEAVEFLKRNKLPLDNRGDDFFVLAQKKSQVVDRWPSSLYI